MRASLCAAAVTALGLSMREHRRRKYAPRADLLLRSAAAARRKAWAARLTQRLVLPLITLPPVMLVPGYKPSQEVKCLNHREAARLQQLEQRDPVHAGGFHGDGIDLARREPIGQGIEVSREAGKLVHRLVVSIRGHGHEVGGASDVDAGGIGVGDRQGRCTDLDRLGDDFCVALNHGLLHHSLRNVALHRVRRLAHSLKQDIGAAAVLV